MQQTIIALSGKKGSGKNTLADFISKWFLEQNDHLLLDQVRIYSFADTLKDFCIETLGLTREQCYGTDEQKNSPTSYLWENVQDIYLRWKFSERDFVGDGRTTIISSSIEDKQSREYFWECVSRGYVPSLRSGPMTGRECMQVFGTELIRATFGNVWAQSTKRKIKKEGNPLALISDLRFQSEIPTVIWNGDYAFPLIRFKTEVPIFTESGGYVIRLTRAPFPDDNHPSEIDLDGYDWNKPNCFLLDNAKMSIEEQNEAVLPILKQIFAQRNI